MAITPATEYELIFVFTGSGTQVMLNRAVVASLPPSAPAFSLSGNEHDLVVGALTASGEKPFAGNIDAAEILTTAELADILG